MKNSYNVIKEKMSPASVLEILQDDQRQSSQYDPEVDGDIKLSFESTIDDWRQACDLVAWKALGLALNDWFDIEYSNLEWKNVLEPSSEKTLFKLCTFIANKAERNEIKPFNIFGTHCKTAGVFISVRKALKDAGIPTEDIKPSSELEPILIKYGFDFIREVGKLAPNVLPPVKIKSSFLQMMGYWVVLVGVILGFSNAIFEINFILQIAYSLTIGGVLLIIVTSRMNPKSFTLGELKTFADVCTLISKSTVKH